MARYVALFVVVAIALTLSACDSGNEQANEPTTEVEQAIQQAEQDVGDATEEVAVSGESAEEAQPGKPLTAEMDVTYDSEGWSFHIDRLDVYAQMDGDSPEHGAFLVLLGSIENHKDDSDCLHSNDFKLRNTATDEEYDADFGALDDAKELYGLDYPGVMKGLCVDAGESAETFYLFDAPPGAELDFVFRERYGGSWSSLGVPAELATAPGDTAHLDQVAQAPDDSAEDEEAADEPEPTDEQQPTDEPQPTATPKPDPGKWKVSESINEFDDSRQVILRLDAEEKVEGWIGSSRPELIIQCTEGETNVIVRLGMQASVEPSNFQKHTVRVRLDDGEAREILTSEGTDSENLFFPNGQAFAQELTEHDVMLFGFTPFEADPQSTTFILTGIADAIVPLREACGW